MAVQYMNDLNLKLQKENKITAEHHNPEGKGNLEVACNITP
jgi:hypothetical protein